MYKIARQSHYITIFSTTNTRLLNGVSLNPNIISQSLYFILFNFFHNEFKFDDIHTLLYFSIVSEDVAIFLSWPYYCCLCFQKMLFMHECYYLSECCLSWQFHFYLLAAYSVRFLYYCYFQIFITLTSIRCLAMTSFHVFLYYYIIKLIIIIIYSIIFNFSS